MATCRLAVAVCRGMYVAADQAADSIGELPWISRRIGALNILINAVTDIDFQMVSRTGIITYLDMVLAWSE